MLERLGDLSLHWKIILAVAAVILVAELGLGRLAPRSRAYTLWKAGVERLAAFWTAIILSLVYVLSVGPVSLAMRLARRDLLDRRLTPRASSWHAHEPNPLGPTAAARHQF
jgi:hypothetical protein